MTDKDPIAQYSGEAESTRSKRTDTGSSFNLPDVGALLSRFSTRALMILALAAPGVALETGCAGCSSPDVVDVEQDEIIKFIELGGYTFDAYRTERVRIDDSHGNTLSHFIVAHLNDKNLYPAGIDDSYITGGVIDLCKALNPGMNLDDFSALNGQEIIFPDFIRVSQGDGERTIRTSPSSEAEMLDAALADGFDVRDVSKQEGYYKDSLERGVPIPTTAKYFFRKENNGDHSPAVLRPDALMMLIEIGEKFHKKTGGYQFSYTDVLRDLDAQAKVYAAKGKGTYNATTHTTGRAIDVGDGRFKDPQGNEFTWSGSDEKTRTFIETTLRDAIVASALESGAIVFPEPRWGHYHIYLPSAGGGFEATIDFGFRAEPEARGCATKKDTEQGASSPETVDLPTTDFERKTGAILLSMADIDLLTAEEVDQKLSAIEAERARLHTLYKTETPGLHALLYNYANLDPLLAGPYANTPENKIQEAINNTNRNSEARKQAIYMKDYYRYHAVAEDLMNLVNRMSSEDMKRTKMLDGTVFDNKKGFEFYDVEEVWKKKQDRKSRSADAEYYEAVRAGLDGLDNSVDLRQWYEEQRKACELFQKHSPQLGVRSEIAQYITPATLFAVLHGEFMSEFPGPTYFEVAPTIFPAANVAFGPAVNDNEFSAGVVQVIRPTLEDIITWRYEELEAIAAAEPEYGLIVPAKRKAIKGKGGKIARWTFDQTEFSQAMLLHTPSQFFYAALVTADHLSLGFDVLMKDRDFVKAWEKADDAQRSVFVGTFAPMTINTGKYAGDDIATNLLANVNGTSLADYSEAVPAAARQWSRRSYGARNAERGYATMMEFLRRDAKREYLKAFDSLDEEPKQDNDDSADSESGGWFGSWFDGEDEAEEEPETPAPKYMEGSPQSGEVTYMRGTPKSGSVSSE